MWLYEVRNENGLCKTVKTKKEAESIKSELLFSCVAFIKRVSSKKVNSNVQNEPV